MTKKEHPYADILRAVADGETVQYFFAGEWKDFPLDGIPGLPYKLRVKPRTIRIGDYDVPEPVHAKLNYRNYYFIPDIADEELAIIMKWRDTELDFMFLERGLIHLDRESASLHAKALISLTDQK